MPAFPLQARSKLLDTVCKDIAQRYAALQLPAEVSVGEIGALSRAHDVGEVGRKVMAMLAAVDEARENAQNVSTSGC